MRGVKWYEQKEKAIALRKQGMSLGKVSIALGLPKATLSGWFKDVPLTKVQKTKLLRDHTAHLPEARKKAVAWHNAQKKARMIEALRQGQRTVDELKLTDKNILDLALAILYLGEGAKTGEVTSMGNSNPLILRFFITALRRVYKIENENIRCELHLRADQNATHIKRYWSKELKVPLGNFRTVSFDPRTKGSATYPHYKGVCVVRCGRADIQRKLMALSMLYCEQIVSDYMGG